MTAACGGGGGGASVPGGQAAGAMTAGKAVVTIPNRTTSSSTRRAQFVSPSSSSVAVSVNGGTPTYADVSTSSPICTTTSGARTCTIPVTALPGNATFTFTFYDGPNGTGKELGVGTASQTLAPNTSFTVAVAVSGIVASVAIVVPLIEAPVGVAVSAVAKDADGNTIIGPDPYTTPITLTNSDTSGTLTLSTTTVNSPNDVVTLTYNGSPVSSAATISASVTGLASSAITPASVLPLDYFPINLARTYTYAETDTDGSTPIGTASPVPSYPPDTSGGTYTQTITGGATYNGVSNLQLLSGEGPFAGGGGLFGSPTSNRYQLFQNGMVLFVADVDNGPGYADKTVYSPGFFYTAVPLVTAATVTTSPPYNGTNTFSLYGTAGGTDTNLYGRDANVNFTSSDAFSDGSSDIEHDNADGSASQSYTGGTGTCSSSWDNELGCSMTAATATVGAPTGGTIAVTVTQTTASGTQTGSQNVPVATAYPQGLPAVPYAIVSTVNGPVSSLPASCNVTVQYSGPVIQVTLGSTYWYPSSAGVYSSTEVDYLAPSIGLICSTYSQNQLNTYIGDSFATLPLTMPAYQYYYTIVRTDSLTGVAAIQSGTIGTTAHSRATMSSKSTRLRRALNGGRLP